MSAVDRVIDRGDYIEIKVSDLAADVVAAIRGRMLDEGFSEVAE